VSQPLACEVSNRKAKRHGMPTAIFGLLASPAQHMADGKKMGMILFMPCSFGAHAYSKTPCRICAFSLEWGMPYWEAGDLPAERRAICS
jgi:hypothetical protein